MIQDNSYLKTHLQIRKMEDIDIVETRSTLSEDTTISKIFLVSMQKIKLNKGHLLPRFLIFM